MEMDGLSETLKLHVDNWDLKVQFMWALVIIAFINLNLKLAMDKYDRNVFSKVPTMYAKVEHWAIVYRFSSIVRNHLF